MQKIISTLKDNLIVVKKILITGAYGQLGSEIKERHGKIRDCIFHFHDKDSLDLFDVDKIKDFIHSLQPDYIINCAAYTAVDKAEEEKDIAFKLNAEVPGKLAELASENQAKLIHVSTDYVFDGKSYRPYVEDDQTGPQSYYGYTKLAGEEMVMKYPGHSIVRTSWLYSAYGSNFVKTMLRLGKERDSLGIVFDQVGSPTYAGDLADTLLKMTMLEKPVQSEGIFHYSNEGVCSWYDFTKAIMELAGLACEIHPIESKNYPLPAPRPFYSVLNKAKIKENLDIQIPYWKDSLNLCLSRIKE
jgi:dTDP-4-dehydrorhamnose reductase